MNLKILMSINSDPKQKQFLREHSYRYKYLNRNEIYYKDFINDMKEKYKLTTIDKLNKISDDINMFRTFLEVLK